MNFGHEMLSPSGIGGVCAEGGRGTPRSASTAGAAEELKKKKTRHKFNLIPKGVQSLIREPEADLDILKFNAPLNSSQNVGICFSFFFFYFS